MHCKGACMKPLLDVLMILDALEKEGSFAAAARSISLSFLSLYSFISRIVINLIPHFPESSINSEVRIIEPSPRIISQHTPHSLSPARRIKSTVASVWPSRSRTPLSLAISGNICPGLLKSSAFAPSATHLCTVAERSCAEMPVEVPT